MPCKRRSPPHPRQGANQALPPLVVDSAGALSLREASSVVRCCRWTSTRPPSARSPGPTSRTRWCAPGGRTAPRRAPRSRASRSADCCEPSWCAVAPIEPDGTAQARTTVAACSFACTNPAESAAPGAERTASTSVGTRTRRRSPGCPAPTMPAGPQVVGPRQPGMDVAASVHAHQRQEHRLDLRRHLDRAPCEGAHARAEPFERHPLQLRRGQDRSRGLPVHPVMHGQEPAVDQYRTRDQPGPVHGELERDVRPPRVADDDRLS